MDNKLRGTGKDSEKREEVISAWKTRIQKSKDFQNKNSGTWKRNELLIYGTESPSRGTNEVAYGWGLIKALETAIYVQNPDCIVEPYGEENMELGTMLTSLVRFDFDMMDLKSIGNLGLIDNFIAGYAAYIESVDTYRSKRTDEETKKDYAVVDEQEYNARRIHYRDILFDFQGTRIDLSDHRYLCVAWYPTVSDLKDGKERGDFPDLPDEEDLMALPSSYAGERHDPQESAKQGDRQREVNDETDPHYKTVCCWEIWDRIKKKVVYVLDHDFCEIGTIDWPANFKIGQRDMFPVTLMAFHPVQKGFYPKPEMDLIANQLMILNRLDSMIYTDALTKWRKFVTISGLISPDKASKIVDTAPENAIIEVDLDQLKDLAMATQSHQMPDLNNLVVRLQDPAPTNDMIAVREMAKSEINDIIGYGPAERGGLPKTRSAREAVAINERLNARLAKRADAVADFYRLFGTKHLLLLQQTLQVERYARVFSWATGPQFQAYEADDIQGNFNFRVFAGTSAPRTTEAKLASEMQLLQTLMPMIQSGMIPPEPVILRIAEAAQWVGVGGLLKNYKPAVKQLAAVLAAYETQPDKVPPQMILEVAAAVVQAVLSPQEIQGVAQEVGGTDSQGRAQDAKPGPPPEPAGMRGDPAALATEAGAVT